MGIKKVQFQKEDSIKFLSLSNAKRWPWEYLGKDTFALTEEQIKIVKEQGIPFTEVKSTPAQTKKDHF